MQLRYLDRYEIDEDRSRLDFGALHAWLSATYWSPGISREEIRRGAEGSTMVLGAYADGKQAGYLRLVSDKVRFAYFMDVYVDAAHRGRGLGRAMVGFALDHPDLKDVYQWLLATADAHGVYAKLGFAPLPEPGRFLILRRERPGKPGSGA